MGAETSQRWIIARIQRKNACAMEKRHTCNDTEAGVSPEGWTAARETQEPAQDNMDKGGCR